MSHDAVNHWVEKAKTSAKMPPAEANAQTNKRSGTQTRGNMILEIAERLRPWFMKLFEDVRDEHDMFVQPAKVRAIALNVAQRIVKAREADNANA